MSAASDKTAMPPLYIDVDGTLTYSDLLFETFLLLLKKNPLYVFLCVVWLLRGRSHLKGEIARRVNLDVSLLPYNEPFLAFLQQQHAIGRPLILASASHKILVQKVADHLGLFSDVVASDDEHNLKSGAKLRAIEQHAGNGRFAYAGNDMADLAVWQKADEMIVVNATRPVIAGVAKIGEAALVLPGRPFQVRHVARALRLHQWAKNLLLFLPLMAAHELSADKWLATFLGFVALGLCASATYVINDLLDLASDRAHQRKRKRPFAALTLSIPNGMALIVLLLPLSLWLAWQVSFAFMQFLLLYIVITLTYSARLKQLPFIDVMVLAFLYTYRILAGGLAAHVEISNWLLAVSLFMFLSLALVKRCAELEFMNEAGRTSVKGRGYRNTDLPYLISMGISSGFMAVMVLALYIDSQAGDTLYPSADLLWWVLPVVLIWLMRLWIKVSRMEIHDDPVQFAITDAKSWAAGILLACIIVAASLEWSL